MAAPLGARSRPSISRCRATSRITQAKSLTIKTEQPASHRGMPCCRDFISSGHQVDVLERLDQWYGPDYRYIKGRATDGGLYILRLDERQAEWELTTFKSARAQVRKDRA